MTFQPTAGDPKIEGWSWEEIDAAVHVRPEVEGSVGQRDLRRTAKGALSTIAGVILAVFALSATVLTISTRIAADGQRGVLGRPVMIVLSGSMAPTIHTGDLVVDTKLTPAQAAALHVGQIISFRASAGARQIVTHRITAIVVLPDGNVAYVTKGDANDSQDGLVVPSTDVVGLYQARIPYGRYVLNALHRPLVLGLLLAAPLFWLLSGCLWKRAARADEPSGTTATEGGEPPS